jgi:hypothetical protein
VTACGADVQAVMQGHHQVEISESLERGVARDRARREGLDHHEVPPQQADDRALSRVRPRPVISRQIDGREELFERGGDDERLAALARDSERLGLRFDSRPHELRVWRSDRSPTTDSQPADRASGLSLFEATSMEQRRSGSSRPSAILYSCQSNPRPRLVCRGCCVKTALAWATTRGLRDPRLGGKQLLR